MYLLACQFPILCWFTKSIMQWQVLFYIGIYNLLQYKNLVCYWQVAKPTLIISLFPFLFLQWVCFSLLLRGLYITSNVVLYLNNFHIVMSLSVHWTNWCLTLLITLELFTFPHFLNNFTYNYLQFLPQKK